MLIVREWDEVALLSPKGVKFLVSELHVKLKIGPIDYMYCTDIFVIDVDEKLIGSHFDDHSLN